jgi:hypothetical protein
LKLNKFQEIKEKKKISNQLRRGVLAKETEVIIQIIYIII